jgi:hypothetical protein
VSGSILRNTFHPSSASRSTFPSGRTQKGRHLEIALAKLLASPNRCFLVFPSGIFSSERLPPLCLYNREITGHAWVLSGPLLAVRVKHADSGKFPSRISSPANIYRLFMKSQARPRSPATHIWNWMTFVMYTILHHLFCASISSVPRSCTLSRPVS